MFPVICLFMHPHLRQLCMFRAEQLRMTYTSGSTGMVRGIKLFQNPSGVEN